MLCRQRKIYISEDLTITCAGKETTIHESSLPVHKRKTVALNYK